MKEEDQIKTAGVEGGTDGSMPKASSLEWKPLEDWEEAFDKEWETDMLPPIVDSGIIRPRHHHEDIKSFIRHEINRARGEAYKEGNRVGYVEALKEVLSKMMGENKSTFTEAISKIRGGE